MKHAQSVFMTNLRIIFAGLVAICFSAPLIAQTAPAIIVTEEGAAWRIKVEAKLSLPHKKIWATLTDCGRARDFIPHFESCRIIDKDPAGRWDLRENISNPPFLPRNRTIIRSDYRAPQSLSYRLVSGDMRLSEGRWELLPQGSGTLLRYQALVEPLVAIPGFLMVPAIKRDVAEMIRKLGEASSASSGD